MKLRFDKTRTALYLMIVFTPFSLNTAQAASSLQQRSSYNSEQQQTYSFAGNWGFDEKAYGSASFTHARTPLGRFFGEIDTFYQFTGGVGYAVDNLGFDLGALYSLSPITRSSALGGYFGLTYIFTGEFSDPKEYKEQTIDLLRQQVYEKKAPHPPIFWMRFGFSATSLHSDIVGDFNNSGKQSSMTIDTYYPAFDDLIVALGFAFHSYDDSKGFFSNTTKNNTNLHTALLGATLQGLPKAAITLHGVWQLAPRDALVPRYQATEIESSQIWTHTVDLGWKHQFTKQWYMTPTYEVSIQRDRAFTGIIFELLYLL